MTFTQEEPEGAAGPPVTQNMNFAGGAVFPHLSGLTATLFFSTARHTQGGLGARKFSHWGPETVVPAACPPVLPGWR